MRGYCLTFFKHSNNTDFIFESNKNWINSMLHPFTMRINRPNEVRFSFGENTLNKQ